MKTRTKDYILSFFKKHPELEYLNDEFVKTIELFTNLKTENKILVCGNGGSAADSEHIAGELLKSFCLKRQINTELKNKLTKTYPEEGEIISNNLQQGVKCIPLTSFTAYNTAFANDCDGNFVFAQLVNALGIEGDCLIAISTSGNSKNVVYAAKLAKVMGLKVVALTGSKGGKLKDIADVLFNVPSDVTFEIQEYHLPIYHLICLCVESELFEE